MNGPIEATTLGDAPSRFSRVTGRILLFLILAIQPLLVDGASFLKHVDPQEKICAYLIRPKVIGLGVCVATGLLYLVCRRIGGWRPSWPSTWNGRLLLGLGVAFLAWLIVSSAFTVQDAHRALWGSAIRMDGLVSQLLWYALVPICLGVTLASGASPSGAVRFAILGGMFITAWTLIQSFKGIEPASWVWNLGYGGTPNASFGHHSLVGGYLAVLLVTASVLAIEGDGTPGPWLTRLAIAVLSAGLVASLGRAGWVSAGAGGLAYLLSLRWRRPGGVAAVLACAALASVGGLFVYGSSHDSSSRVRSMSTVVQGGDVSVNHRFITWRAALRASRERPFVGGGPEAFAELVWTHVTPEEEHDLYTEFTSRELVDAGRVSRSGNRLFMRNDSGQVVEFSAPDYDKAHNYYLDLALQNGWPATLLFVAFLACASWRMWTRGDPCSFAVMCGVWTYLVFGLAWFYTPMVDPSVWALLGVGLAGTMGSRGALVEAAPSEAVGAGARRRHRKRGR